MPVYVALLRGINVGAHKRMKMEKLVACCKIAGFEQAKTYIQSGNIVFRAKASAETISKKLEQQIVNDFGFSADVVCRSQEEMEKIITRNPLLKESGVEPEKLHVVFLSQALPPAAVKRLQELTLPPDRVRIAGKEVYFYFPNGVSGSSLWKHPMDKVLGVSFTMRNWNTVNKLHEMAEACV